VRLLPNSPRRRRRVAWIGGALAAVLAFGLAIVLLPKADPAPESALSGSAAEQQALPSLRLTRARRAEIDSVVHRFVESAVTRGDPPAAWPLASRSMRAGVARDAWDRGDLPGVTPFPAAAVRDVSWSVAYRAPSRVGLDVLVVAKPGSGQRSLVYQADLVLENGRLLVETWTPEATLTAGAATAAKTGASSAAATKAPSSQGRLDARWLLLPAGILLVLLGSAAFVIVRHAVRSRRAYRRYREHAGT
jgi:hypothetical protein